MAIFASNLDEFFMVRVAGLKRRESTGLGVRSADGLTVREQLALIAGKTRELMRRHAEVFTSDVEPALRAEGVRLLDASDLDDDQRERVASFFDREVFPVLTPLAVDPAHPFPYISGLSLNLAVLVRDRRSGAERFARVKVPNNLARFVRLDDDGGEQWLFLPMEEVLAQHLDKLFPGKEVVEHHLFRVTRNADLEVEEDRDEDLLQALERELARRRFGPAVRLEVAESMEPRVLELLERELEVDPADVQRLPGLLDLSSMWELYGLDVPRLKDAPHVPASHPALVEGESAADVFSALRDDDVLVHHPYDSFATSVQRFIEQAADDPNVLAIKQTLYRTSGDSPVVDALVEAAEAGKQVVVLVELKARFDEDNNIRWARKLERAGCHVVYGLVGLKTHTKIALVVRSEGARLRRYSHVGTGNYNPKTARIYEDLGLLTADPEVGADLTDLFNTLTGYSDQREYRRLLVAPHGVRRGVVDRVEAQAQRRPGRRLRAGPDQGQLAGRRGGLRRPVRRVEGRGAGRPGRPRHLLAAPRGRGPEREHPGPQRRRPLARAQPDLRVRRGRRRRALDRQRRPDAPQPGPAGRGDRAGRRAPGRAARGPARRLPGRRRRRLGARRRRLLDAPGRDPPTPRCATCRPC